jgi:hypothetical protein
MIYFSQVALVKTQPGKTFPQPVALRRLKKFRTPELRRLKKFRTPAQ